MSYVQATHLTSEEVAAMRAKFEADVAEHVLDVKYDNGLYRHLVFCKASPSFLYRFEVSTWPGYIAIVGDMGSYLFSRVEDMFEFFRGRTRGPFLDLSYLAGKLQAADKNGGISHWIEAERSVQKLVEILRDALDEAVPTETIDAVVAEFMEHAESDEIETVEDVYRVAMDFEPRTDIGRESPFGALWEQGTLFYEWSYHFQWCVFALAYAVEQYDNRKAQQAAIQSAELSIEVKVEARRT